VAPTVSTAFGGRPLGDDFAVGGDRGALAAARAQLAVHPWTWLRQVHGADVVVVATPGAGAGTSADAAVTSVSGAVLAIHTADCVPVLLADPDAGVIGAAHAGWRGLVAGVLGATVDAMVRLGAQTITAQIGPHIRGRCYEFTGSELSIIADRFGPDVRTATAWGTVALDMTAGVALALAERSIDVVDLGGCTACEPQRLFSHRARADNGRHASTIVLEP
jgi:YfiH family protein